MSALCQQISNLVAIEAPYSRETAHWGKEGFLPSVARPASSPLCRGPCFRRSQVLWGSRQSGVNRRLLLLDEQLFKLTDEVERFGHLLVAHAPAKMEASTEQFKLLVGKKTPARKRQALHS